MTGNETDPPVESTVGLQLKGENPHGAPWKGSVPGSTGSGSCFVGVHPEAPLFEAKKPSTPYDLNYKLLINTAFQPISTPSSPEELQDIHGKTNRPKPVTDSVDRLVTGEHRPERFIQARQQTRNERSIRKDACGSSKTIFGTKGKNAPFRVI